MNNMKEDKLFELYTLAELSYQRHFKDITNNVVILYPKDWYARKNYKEKIDIITEAIKTNTLIINTSLYQNTIEGIDREIINDNN